MGNRAIASRTKADGKKDEEEARGNNSKFEARIMKVMDVSIVMTWHSTSIGSW